MKTNDEISFRDVFLYKVKNINEFREKFPESIKGNNLCAFDCVHYREYLQILFYYDIFIILTKKSKLVREQINEVEYKFKNFIDPIKLTEKKFVNFLFENDYSENLMEIEIERDHLYDVFDTDYFVGSCINYTSTYKKILDDKEIHIKFIKMQPLNSKFTISFIESNLLHFSNDMNKDEAILIMDKFQSYIKDYGGSNENNTNC